MTGTRTPEGAHEEEGRMPEDVRQKRVLRWLFVLVPAFFILSLVVFVIAQWDEYNPFWERTPKFREVQALAVTLYARELTDAEFDRTLELCESGHVRARVDAVSVVEQSVKRNPQRAGPAAPVMKRVARARNAMLREAAERLLKRIEGPPAPK
jgi:hypothetical protein